MEAVILVLACVLPDMLVRLDMEIGRAKRRRNRKYYSPRAGQGRPGGRAQR